MVVIEVPSMEGRIPKQSRHLVWETKLKEVNGYLILNLC
jgi:hypothetical protein